ncbi:KRFJ protein, partial [Alcedo cyanopectus]|nr:KRFJ protein [Ceyx cyanopectus]
MSPYNECCLPEGALCPKPFTLTSSETCVIKYPDTIVDIVEPNSPPYSVIYPGPTLTTFPQQTLVGTTALFNNRNLLCSGGSPGFRDVCGSGTACNSALPGHDAGNFNSFPPHMPKQLCCRTFRPA